MQFKVCDHGEPPTSPDRKEECFHREKGTQEGYTKQKVLSFSVAKSLPGKKWLSSLWALLLLQGVRAPPSGFSSLFNLGLYCINFFKEAAWISNINISAMKYEYWH